MNDSARRERLRRWDRMKLTLFAVRHTLGVGIFVWLTIEIRRLIGGWQWLIVALFGLVYAVFALAAWARLRGQLRRRESGGLQ